MNIEEESILDNYKKSSLSLLDQHMPNEKYTDLCFNYGGEYLNLTKQGKSLPADSPTIFKQNEDAYISMLSLVLNKFKDYVDSEVFSVDQFPVREWKYIANREETRFLMRDFYELYALTTESIINNKNSDFLIQVLGRLDGEECSKIMGNLKDPKTVVTLMNSIERVRPELLSDESFNPLASMVNEGNHKLLKVALVDEGINDLFKRGKIKAIDNIGISGDLLKRLGSTFDQEKKKNIIEAIKVLSSFDLLNDMQKDLHEKDPQFYMSISQIEPEDRLSYSEIVLFSKNEVPIFSNNNDRLVREYKIHEEKRGNTLPIRPRF